MTFKESILSKLFVAAKEYEKLLGFSFVFKSNHFIYRSEYLIKFYKDNFLHLTGVETRLNAKEFYDKCVSEDLKLEDFECEKTNELKGKVREKLKNLSNLGTFFNRNLIFQEMLEKNRVKCKIASSDGKYTLGFVQTSRFIHVPLTLLNKNQIDLSLAITEYEIIKK